MQGNAFARRWAMPIVILAAATLHRDAALASDYFHECRSSDGLYEMSDGELYDTKDKTRTRIPYEKLNETVLAERRGYCVANGAKYEFEARTYVMTIRFRWNAQPVEARVLCDLAADGLPASFNCEREVITLQSTGDTSGRADRQQPSRPSQSSPADHGGPRQATHWLHNGSLMRLEATGAERRFVYQRPRKGMLAAGAKPGDPVFVGRRDGASYTGTAYVYSRACGRTPYQVAGTIGADERSVTLEGNVPLLASDCSPSGHRPDVLRFTLADG